MAALLFFILSSSKRLQAVLLLYLTFSFGSHFLAPNARPYGRGGLSIMARARDVGPGLGRTPASSCLNCMFAFAIAEGVTGVGDLLPVNTRLTLWDPCFIVGV